MLATHKALVVNASNSVALHDALIEDVYGPAAIDIGASLGARVDIVQIQRLTTNQIAPKANARCVRQGVVQRRPRLALPSQSARVVVVIAPSGFTWARAPTRCGWTMLASSTAVSVCR